MLRISGKIAGIPEEILSEVAALKHIQKSDQTPSGRLPRLIDVHKQKQPSQCWLPGALIVSGLLEPFTGVRFTYEDFYSMPFAKRKLIRDSFLETLQ